MKHNAKNNNDLGRSNHFSLKEVVAMITALTLKVDSVSSNVSKMMFLLLTENTMDISDFFPIKSMAKMNEFMDRTHPEFNIRLREFNNLLLLCADDNIKKFADALLAALFDRKFLSFIIWPTPG